MLPTSPVLATTSNQAIVVTHDSAGNFRRFSVSLGVAEVAVNSARASRRGSFLVRSGEAQHVPLIHKVGEWAGCQRRDGNGRSSMYRVHVNVLFIFGFKRFSPFVMSHAFPP